MIKNISKIISFGSLFIIFVMISCSNPREIEKSVFNLNTASEEKSNTPTATVTPTEYFVNATTFAEATLWAIKSPISTTPPNFPTPQMPPTQQFFAKDIPVQNNQPLIVGEYILRSWVRIPFETDIVTISRIGKKQMEVQDDYVSIDKITGKDLTGDGFPEAVIRNDNSGAGAGALCSYISIISLADEPTLLLDKTTTCGYIEDENHFAKLVDYFIDINHDGKTEYISFYPPKDEDGYHFNFSKEFMLVWEYNAEANAFDVISRTELSFIEFREKITELEKINK